MKDLLTDQQNEAILKALDDALENGPWDQSNFLRALGKSLSEIRNDFAVHLDSRDKEQMKADSARASNLILRSQLQEVFISLYSADGSNLQSWEKIVSNLPGQMISRPIYASEELVKALLKMKDNKQNEAYVAIYINKSDIIPLAPDKALVDKLGNPLLSLKAKALNLDNISRFVHVSGVYQFVRTRLIKG